jgi:hypothetical protein
MVGLVAVVMGVFGLMMFVVTLVQVDMASALVSAVAIFVISWLAGRFSLVFPAIATGGDVTFGESWGLTKGYQSLLFLVVIGLPIFLALPIYFLAFVPYSLLLSSLVSTFIVVFEVAALSMAYQLITNGVSEKL